MNKECEKCFKRKTMLCPNSKLCYSTKDKPYFLTYEEALKIISKISDEAINIVRKELKNDTSK